MSISITSGAPPLTLLQLLSGSLADANHVFILNDKEEAAYFHNDMEQLTNALDICFFPDSFKRTGNFNELNSSHVMLRTEALTKFSSKTVA